MRLTALDEGLPPLFHRGTARHRFLAAILGKVAVGTV